MAHRWHAAGGRCGLRGERDSGHLRGGGPGGADVRGDGDCVLELPVLGAADGGFIGRRAVAGSPGINSGNLAGYVSPFAIGLIRDRTHSMFAALLVLSGTALLGGLLTLYVARKQPRAS